MRPFSHIQTADWQLQKIQDNVAQAVDPIARLPLLDGVFLEGIALVTGSDNVVSHKLDRQPRMWIIADNTAQATVWRTGWSAKFLKLRTSANCTINLWVA